MEKQEKEVVLQFFCYGEYICYLGIQFIENFASSIAYTKVCYITTIIIVSTLINRDSKEQLVHDDEPLTQEKVSMLVNSVCDIAIFLYSNHYHS